MSDLLGTPFAEEPDPRARASLAEEWARRHSDTTKKMGDIVRQLCLGGFAAIWVLKGEQHPATELLPEKLLVASFFLVLALALDLVHGVLLSWMAPHAARFYARPPKSRRSWEERLAIVVGRHRWISYLFIAKIVGMATAYAFILSQAASALLGAN